MKTLVVGDAHGRFDLVRRLLEAAGVVAEDGSRVRDPEVATVQVGDLIHATGRSRDGDLAVLRKANAWFDVCLVGNHEYPYLGGYGFGGFLPLVEVERCVRNVSWHPAVAVGETLVTHAGVSALLGVSARTAKEAEVELREAWVADRQHPFFAACSPSRHGRSFVGGVLWRDASEALSGAFSQVHGHTPCPNGPRFGGDPDGVFFANVDVGARDGRVSGLWLDEDGRPGELIVASEASLEAEPVA